MTRASQLSKFERAVKHFIGLACASHAPRATCPHAMRLLSVPADFTSASIAPGAFLYNYILTSHFGGRAGAKAAGLRKRIPANRTEADA